MQHRKRRGASNLVRLSEKYSLSHDFNRIVYNLHEPLTSFKKSIWGQQSKGENLYAKSCKTNIGFQFDFSRLYLCPCFSYHLFKFIIIFLSFSRFPHYCLLIYWTVIFKHDCFSFIRLNTNSHSHTCSTRRD